MMFVFIATHNSLQVQEVQDYDMLNCIVSYSYLHLNVYLLKTIPKWNKIQRDF